MLLIGLIREQSFPLNVGKVSIFSVALSLREKIFLSKALIEVCTNGTTNFWTAGYFVMSALIKATFANLSTCSKCVVCIS